MVRSPPHDGRGAHPEQDQRHRDRHLDPDDLLPGRHADARRGVADAGVDRDDAGRGSISIRGMASTISGSEATVQMLDVHGEQDQDSPGWGRSGIRRRHVDHDLGLCGYAWCPIPDPRWDRDDPGDDRTAGGRLMKKVAKDGLQYVPRASLRARRVTPVPGERKETDVCAPPRGSRKAPAIAIEDEVADQREHDDQEQADVDLGRATTAAALSMKLCSQAGTP